MIQQFKNLKVYAKGKDEDLHANRYDIIEEFLEYFKFRWQTYVLAVGAH